MRFGFHISISQGIATVIEKAQQTRCETIQLFSRNPRGWKYRNLPADQVEGFKEQLMKSGISPCVLHLPYLPNLASADPNLYAKSVDSLCADMARAGKLTIPFVVAHVGKRLELSKGRAMARVAAAISRSLKKVPNDVMILLENTAGQGTALGANFGTGGYPFPH